jgi:putative ABC transport system substrate-binding protein
LAAFRQGLHDAGYFEGQNLAIENRWAEGHYDRLPALAADLAGRKVDVIVTAGGITPARAAKNATLTIPIVFMYVGNPVGAGLVASLARPGGNLTGFSNITGELTPKRLELICELVPQATVIALLVNPDNLGLNEQYIRRMQEAARTKGVQLPVLKARTEGEIDAAFASLGQLQVGGLVVSPDPFFNSRSEQLVALSSRYAIPAISELREFTVAGGLLSYGIDSKALARQAGIYVGRILKGESPADLPVQQRQLSSWSLTSKPHRRSASPCRPRYSPAPTRSSIDPLGSIWDAPSRVGTVPTLHLTQIPPADLDVAVLGQLATA